VISEPISSTFVTTASLPSMHCILRTAAGRWTLKPSMVVPLYNVVEVNVIRAVNVTQIRETTAQVYVGLFTPANRSKSTVSNVTKTSKNAEERRHNTQEIIMPQTFDLEVSKS